MLSSKADERVYLLRNIVKGDCHVILCMRMIGMCCVYGLYGDLLVTQRFNVLYLNKLETASDATLMKAK